MSKYKWHKGAPPHVGWWLTHGDSWRWWDGKRWSWGVAYWMSMPTVKYCAKTKLGPFHTSLIEWCDYYPKNARVPRIKP